MATLRTGKYNWNATALNISNPTNELIATSFVDMISRDKLETGEFEESFGLKHNISSTDVLVPRLLRSRLGNIKQQPGNLCAGHCCKRIFPGIWRNLYPGECRDLAAQLSRQYKVQVHFKYDNRKNCNRQLKGCSYRFMGVHTLFYGGCYAGPTWCTRIP